MLITEPLSKAQQRIIRDICIIQLQSLQRLIEGKSYVDPDLIEELQTEDITQEEFFEDLYQKMSKFSELQSTPHLIGKMNNTDLSVVRHLLTNLQDRYQNKYPNAVKNLWKRLFFIEDIRNISLN